MVTIKSFTDIQQSRKLAEILPSDSADMSINNSLFHNMTTVLTTPYKKLHEFFSGNTPDTILPCWSLAALLNIFPCSKESPIVNLTRGGWNPSFTRRWFATWEDGDKNVFYSCDGISPVDAVVGLILKLHEQKLL